MTLAIKIADILRATLPAASGNTGFIGIAPDGSAYHVVVPVDSQIARGIKAGNRPADGTPFGGYNDWHYCQCAPYHDEIEGARQNQTKTNAAVLRAWAASRKVDLEIVE